MIKPPQQPLPVFLPITAIADLFKSRPLRRLGIVERSVFAGLSFKDLRLLFPFYTVLVAKSPSEPTATMDML